MKSRYHYDRLRVACLNPVDFDLADPHALRKAVQYLKTLPDAKFVGIMAETSTTVGHYKLRAKVLLKLDEITGKTPAEVWDLIDAQVDEQRKGLSDRLGS